jgi:hypothetical protein
MHDLLTDDGEGGGDQRRALDDRQTSGVHVVRASKLEFPHEPKFVANITNFPGCP